MDNSIFGPTKIPGPEKTFIFSLVHHQVRFLVIGGYAVHFHGHHRGLEDLDVLAPSDSENWSKICRVIKEEPTSSPFTIDPGQEGKKIHIPLKTCWKDDITTHADGVDFEGAYERRCSVKISGMEIPVIGKSDSIALKLAAQRKSGRRKDWDDVQALQMI